MRKKEKEGKVSMRLLVESFRGQNFQVDSRH